MFLRYCGLVRCARGLGIGEEGLKRAIAHIEANDHCNISLATLASIAQVTPHHFSSQFTRATGMSPHQYVLRARIERAKLHLNEESNTIADVSRLIGFRTQEHFSKVFRRIVGQTPTDYRHSLSAN